MPSVEVCGNNMEWFWLTPQDTTHNNWLFYQENHRLQLRDTYREIACAQCGKVKLFDALQLPLESSVRIRTTHDFVLTEDGVICFSQRAFDIYQQYQLGGLEFIQSTVLGVTDWHIVLPKQFVPVDESIAGFEYLGRPCPRCGLYKYGTAIGPLKESLTLPNNPLTIVSPSRYRENIRGIQTWLLGSHFVREIMEENQITGIDYVNII
jgi:hypothetical protein